MQASLTEYGRQLADESGLKIAPLDRSPFEIHNGKVFVKFDGMEFRNIAGSASGVEIAFQWQGKSVMTVPCHSAKLVPDYVITMDGIEGRQELAFYTR